MDQGIVVRYDADRGFGFIRSRAHGAQEVFVHASTVAGGARLRNGQRVRFTAETTDKGPRATRVEPGRRGLTPATAAALGLAVMLIAGTTGLVFYEKLALAWAWLATINAATFAIYAFDKHRAKAEGRRVPELVLLGLALIGGTIGAVVAMLTLHHKTRKVSFLVPFVVVVIMQIAALAWWWRAG